MSAHAYSRLRRAIGAGAFSAALVLIAWLPLGIYRVVPFVLGLPGESPLRLHTGAAVACLMVAAWAYWEA